MLKLTNVCKSYPTKNGSQKILDNLTFEFKNENTGVLGLNGAGKSTLLRLLSGAEHPDSGTIERTWLMSWPLGFAGGFNGSLSGEENCRFICRIYNKDIEKISKLTKEFSELGDKFHMPIKTYSSGMRSKLSFALSMSIDFDCYLIDELLSVGDQQFQKKCAVTFKERKKHSKIILVTHSPAKVKQHCDSVMVLHQGKIKYYPEVAEGLQAYNNLHATTNNEYQI